MLTFLKSTLWDGNSSFHSVFLIVNLFSWVRRSPRFVHSRKSDNAENTPVPFIQKKSLTEAREIPVFLKLLDAAFLKGS